MPTAYRFNGFSGGVLSLDSAGNVKSNGPLVGFNSEATWDTTAPGYIGFGNNSTSTANPGGWLLAGSSGVWTKIYVEFVSGLGNEGIDVTFDIMVDGVTAGNIVVSATPVIPGPDLIGTNTANGTVFAPFAAGNEVLIMMTPASALAIALTKVKIGLGLGSEL